MMNIDQLNTAAMGQKPFPRPIADASGSTQLSQAANRYSCLFINTYYDAFLGSFYTKKLLYPVYSRVMTEQ